MAKHTPIVQISIISSLGLASAGGTIAGAMRPGETFLGLAGWFGFGYTALNIGRHMLENWYKKHANSPKSEIKEEPPKTSPTPPEKPINGISRRGFLKMGAVTAMAFPVLGMVGEFSSKKEDLYNKETMASIKEDRPIRINGTQDLSNLEFTYRKEDLERVAELVPDLLQAAKNTKTGFDHLELQSDTLYTKLKRYVKRPEILLAAMVLQESRGFDNDSLGRDVSRGGAYRFAQINLNIKGMPTPEEFKTWSRYQVAELMCKILMDKFINYEHESFLSVIQAYNYHYPDPNRVPFGKLVADIYFRIA